MLLPTSLRVDLGGCKGYVSKALGAEENVRTRVVRSVGQPTLDEVDSEVEQLLEVVARVGDLVRLKSEPSNGLEDLVKVDLLFGLGVRIVEAEVAVPAMILGVAKVDGDRLRMSDLVESTSAARAQIL